MSRLIVACVLVLVSLVLAGCGDNSITPAAKGKSSPPSPPAAPPAAPSAVDAGSTDANSAAPGSTPDAESDTSGQSNQMASMPGAGYPDVAGSGPPRGSSGDFRPVPGAGQRPDMAGLRPTARGPVPVVSRHAGRRSSGRGMAGSGPPRGSSGDFRPPGAGRPRHGGQRRHRQG